MSRLRLGRFNPDTLMAICKIPDKPLTGLDGRVASIVDDTVVTSPNADYVPEVLPTFTEVKLRADLRYGPDDATLWPQPYLENYPYLSVIPRKTQDPRKPKSVMWWLPKASDFKQSNTAMVKGVGTLTGAEMDGVKELVRSLLKRVRDYRNGEGKDLGKEDGSVFIDSALVTLTHTWVRLDGSQGTLEEKCMEVSEVQRSYLELKAIMDYYAWRLPRIRTKVDPPSENILGILDVVGCITSQPIIAQECFVAGIPVWLMRDYRVFMGGGIRVDRLVPFTKATSVLTLDERPGRNYCIVFRGLRSEEGRYKEQHRFMRSRLIWTDPWGDSFGDITQPLEVDRNITVGSLTRRLEDLESKPVRRPTSKPYSRPGSSRSSASSSNNINPVKVDRDKYAEVQSPLSPSPICAWEEGLRNVCRDPVSSSSKDSQHHKTYDMYTFPDPAMFLHANPDRRLIYLKHWLLSRPLWLWRASNRDNSQVPLSPQLWRDILYCGVGTGLPVKNSPSFEKVKARVASFGCAFGRDGSLQVSNYSQPEFSTPPPLPGRLEWRGKDVLLEKDGSFPQEVTKEILWELYELNFRSDLIALDRKMVMNAADFDQWLHRQSLMGECFPEGYGMDFNPFHIAFTRENDGFAGNHISSRKKSILTLARLMKGWKVDSLPPTIMTLVHVAESSDLDADQLIQLEKAVATYYCQIFYNVRRRAPITPHRLK